MTALSRLSPQAALSYIASPAPSSLRQHKQPCSAPPHPTSALWGAQLQQARTSKARLSCSLHAADMLSVLSVPVDSLANVLQDLASTGATVGLPAELVNASVGAIRHFQELPQEQQLQLLGGSGLGWFYLTARPGVLAGAVDIYLGEPVQTVVDSVRGRRGYQRTDFVLGARLGEGSFGTVYEAAICPKGVDNGDELGKRSLKLGELEEKGEKLTKVVMKKVKVGVDGAEECGEYEEWFNRRMMRVAPEVCAKYLGSFVADTTRGQFTEGGRWLVWKYDGDSTLKDFMLTREFPYNLEIPSFGKRIKGKSAKQRYNLIIKKLLRQIIYSLKRMHSTGIVHRDVKPSNLVFTNRGQLRFIDFGAATDLRVGKNYFPDRGVLDPDYCPPELYVMPEETPKVPYEPVAAALSPFLWLANHPDLFDMYSVGVCFLQMALPPLRTNVGLQTFKREMESFDYDLDRWRRKTKVRCDFEVLDLDGGKGWDLATKLLRPKGGLFGRRLSAAAALRHPYFLLQDDVIAGVIG